MKNKFIYFTVLAAIFASCEPEFENEVNANYTSGDADFSTYVAVGNSLTAGYMDGTVYKSGQMNSYPNMLAQQFALVGGGAFTQPSYEDDVNNLGGLKLGSLILSGTRLVLDAGDKRPENIMIGGVPTSPTIEVSELQATAYNNAGVPGAKSFHLLAPGYGNVNGVQLGLANPYFARTATVPNATVLGDAMSLNPTFFTNWIGANDVLSYATNGGAQADGVTPAADHNTTGNTDPTTYGGNDITNSGVFTNVYSTLINTLTSNGAKGVVATIPSVTSIPYFTTVPYNPVSAEAINANPQAPLLIQLYQFLAVATNGRIAPLNTAAGETNPVLINDADLDDISSTISATATVVGNQLLATPPSDPNYAQNIYAGNLLISNAATLGAIYGKARQATANDLVVLTASSVIGVDPENSAANPFDIPGVTEPLKNKFVLTANEKAKIAAATTAYNNSIVSIANAKGLAVADMNAIMNQLVSGLKIETGQVYTANYFSGSATEGQVLFSLDGVHPNARGYAVIANAFIHTINEYYHSNLPIKSVNDYPGTQIVLTN